MKGYRYVSGGLTLASAPITPRADVLEFASFIDLVELVAIGRFKEAGYSLATIRRIVDRCQSIFHVNRPLTSLAFKTGGKNVFVDHPDTGLIEVLRTHGQTAWREILTPFLATLEYEGGTVSKWWPLGKNEPIVVDPDYGYGLPVVATTGIRTELIFERFLATASFEEIGHDFNIGAKLVERAVRFEAGRAKAA